MNYKNILQNTISQEATLMVNKKLMAKFGIELAALIAYLIDQERYHEGEEFYCTDSSIQLYTGINKNRIGTIKELGMNSGFFKIVKKGMPLKSFYYLNHEEILKVLSEDVSVQNLAYERELGNESLEKESIMKMSRNTLRILCKKLELPYTGKDLKKDLIEKIFDKLQCPENPVTSDQKIQTLVTEKTGHQLPKNLVRNKELINLETKNKVVAQEKPATANFDTFKKSLKTILPDSLKQINGNTVGNIFNYSNKDINAVREALAYMMANNKTMRANVLVAILKDGDYKGKSIINTPKILTRQEKIEYMKEHMSLEELNNLRDSIKNGLGVTGEHLETHLGNSLCRRYNELNTLVG